MVKSSVRKALIDDRRGDRHERGDQVERADPALNQPARAAPRADDRGDGGVAAHDERREQEKRPERGHLAHLLVCSYRPFSPSYFDGHFAITPSGSCGIRPSPSGVPFSTPFSTTSDSSLNVSGTTPIYVASTTLAVVLQLEPVFERVAACS